MKRLFFWVVVLLSFVVLACGRTDRPGGDVVSRETVEEVQEQQIEYFQQQLLKDEVIGEAERQYILFRLAMMSPTNLSLHPRLAEAFSNEFINSLWDRGAYRLAYQAYLSLTNVFTNDVADRGFLLGRAGIVAFKTENYSIALQLFQQAFETRMSDEVVYYYGLWHWYVQNDRERGREVLSRVRPERLGIGVSEWRRFLAGEAAVFSLDHAVVKNSTNPYYQRLAFDRYIQQNQEPFWSYTVEIPPYAPTNRLGFYLNPMNPRFPRMTRDWPMPFSLRPGRRGQVRHALFLEEPIAEDVFLLLYAQPKNAPWSSGYGGIASLFAQFAYTNAMFVYARAQRDTNAQITNAVLDVVPVPVRYFLHCSPLYRDGRWQYAVVGFTPPATLEVFVFDPAKRSLSRVRAPLQHVSGVYYVDFRGTGRRSWFGVGEGVLSLEETRLGQ